MRYYIIAGERSGDLHGGNLVRAMVQFDPQAEFRGVGGDYMKSGGVNLSIHYSDMAFMGMTEVLTSLNRINNYLKQCKAEILEYKPDAIILIDYGGFNRRVAKFGKRSGIQVFYYITPKVWAWRQRRALHLKRNVDRMFVILPFEKDFFKKFDWDVDYVGNPVLDAIKAHRPQTDFLEKSNLTKEKTLVALLPGSRKQELESLIPVMAAVAKKHSEFQFAVAAVNNVDQTLYGELRKLPNVTFIFENTYNLLLNANAAIVASGTATLETALFRVPQAVIYKISVISYWIAKLVVKVPFISLVNLIAGREVVRELIQKDCNPETIGGVLEAMIKNDTYRSQILSGYDEIIRILDTGSASENTARLMVGYLKK